MLEQDESLRVVSQMPERDQYSVHIQEILGVRGHLNNELLRIQQMLAANDPRMKVRQHALYILTVGCTVQRFVK